MGYWEGLTESEKTFPENTILSGGKEVGPKSTADGWADLDESLHKKCRQQTGTKGAWDTDRIWEQNEATPTHIARKSSHFKNDVQGLFTYQEKCSDGSPDHRERCGGGLD